MMTYNNLQQSHHQYHSSTHVTTNLQHTHPIIVLDNGSYSIKAGFSGNSDVSVIFPNCAAQPFGRRMMTNIHSHGINHSHSTSHQVFNGTSSHTASHSNLTNHLIAGDDLYTIPEYFCVRPFQYGLLMDTGLEIGIWDTLFSKHYLNISDPSSHSILVTEHYNTPSNSRYMLTQIVFEEFQFDRMVISPGQQLVPFAFTSPLVSEPNPGHHLHDPINKKKSKKRVSKQDNNHFHLSLQSHTNESLSSLIIGDKTFIQNNALNNETIQKKTSYCQLVIDVGHQTTWIVPMYGDLPIEAGVIRLDIGGSHISSLLKNILAYRQIDLERNELLVHHIKEESCFISLNYMADLRLSKGQLPYPSAIGYKYPTFLTHQYILPDLNLKDGQKQLLKQFFQSKKKAPLPHYTHTNGLDYYPVIETTPNRTPTLRQLIENHPIEASQNSQVNQWNDIEDIHTIPDNILMTQHPIKDIPSIYLGIERIKAGEVLFYPSDYDFPTLPTTASITTTSVSHMPTSSTAPTKESTILLSTPLLKSLSTLQPPNPVKQCGLVEAIEKSIHYCPSVLQPMIASRIFLCGGSTCMGNFAKRLYSELRQCLPQEWPINIYQLDNPSCTTWLGGSTWASANDHLSYDTFCLTRAQYNETQ